MTRQLRHNLILALIVAGLALFLLFRPQSAGPEKFRLSTLAAETVKKIVITRGGNPPMILEKRGNDWQMTAPWSARVDRMRADGALELLKAQSDTRLPMRDLDRFELDKPAIRLQIDGQEFTFGGRQPVSNQIYVATVGHVYLVSPVFLSDAGRRTEDFLSKKPLADDEVPTAFALPGLTLTRSDGKWLRQPDKTDLSADQLNRFADEWRLASAAAVTRASDGKPLERIDVTLANGKTLRFALLAREPDVVLRREDEQLEYRFVRDAGLRLLNPVPPMPKTPPN